MNLLTAFNRQCDSLAEQIALIEGDNQINYAQLRQQAGSLSAEIKTNYPDCQRIIIALDRGIDAVVAILAALGCGACYIPLDINNPVNRKQFIIEDADAQCIIGRGDCPEWIKQKALWLDISLVFNNKEYTNWPRQLSEQALAAILYTSGSTGTPKGVALSHKAMFNFSHWAGSTFGICQHDKIASLAPFHFDLSVFDLFTGLSNGACIHFVPKLLTLSPSRLTQWLSEHKISVWYTVPSLLSFITMKGALAETDLSCLKTLLFAGEVFPSAQLIKLSNLLPEVNLYNLYGPTETNVCCYWPVDKTRLNPNEAIPIGLPACDSKLKIDPNTGELLVQGPNNLSGYWQQGKLIPALSDENFYPTGDKVSINTYGEYCYHGRLDRMLKCSGYRVEPAEIEHLIMQSPLVNQCAVIGLKDAASGQRPAAALVLKQNSDLNDVIKAIKQQLPNYMQPVKLITLDTLPCLSNGKTDYLAIQKQLENT